MTQAQLAALPLHMDGSDGSLWPARASVEDALENRADPQKLFVKLSDLLDTLGIQGEVES